jgi:purine-binding chemotaxis protein CheW
LSTDAVGPSLALAVEERSPARRACVVRLGGRSFAVDVVDAREVVVLDAITPVPGAPEPLVGVMNLRGTALPVIEVRPLLGLPVRGALRALVVADGDRRAAVLIEAVLGLAGFDDITPLAGTEGVPPALVHGRVTTESGETVTLLDAPALLAAARRAWNPGATSRAGHRGA